MTKNFYVHFSILKNPDPDPDSGFQKNPDPDPDLDSEKNPDPDPDWRRAKKPGPGPGRISNFIDPLEPGLTNKVFLPYFRNK